MGFPFKQWQKWFPRLTKLMQAGWWVLPELRQDLEWSLSAPSFRAHPKTRISQNKVILPAELGCKGPRRISLLLQGLSWNGNHQPFIDLPHLSPEGLTIKQGRWGPTNLSLCQTSLSKDGKDTFPAREGQGLISTRFPSNLGKALPLPLLSRPIFLPSRILKIPHC